MTTLGIVITTTLSIIVIAMSVAVKRMYDKIVFYEDWFESFANMIEQSKIRLEQIDRRGTFKSDDEVGYFFKFLKQLMRQLYKMGFYEDDEINF